MNREFACISLVFIAFILCSCCSNEALITNQHYADLTKILYDGTRGETIGEYECMWIITIVFDDGSYFQTNGVGDHAPAWPEKYYTLKDELFNLAKS